MQKRKYPLGLTMVAIFAIIAGLGEVVVGLTGNYLGILNKSITPSLITAVVGSFYSIGGIALLTRRKWGAALGMLFILGEILGRVYLVAIGIAPSSGVDTIKIIIGGMIAFGVILYIWSLWNNFK